MNTTVKIDNKEYEVDVAKAIQDGYLKPSIPIPLCIGNVYKHPHHLTNPFLLVKAVYFAVDGRAYQLLGMGTKPNSDDFFNSLHTEQEIKDYLNQYGMVYSHNIDAQISRLVNN